MEADGTAASGVLRAAADRSAGLVWMPFAPIVPGTVVTVRVGGASADLLADDAGNGVAAAVRTVTWP